MSMASCPFVRNPRSSGRPVTSDFTGSSTCSRGIHCRAPTSAWPGLLPDVGQVHGVDPVRDPARAAHVLALHPGRRGALLLLARLVQRPDRQPPAPATGGAASSSPATAYLLTWLIAAVSSHDARFSSRCVRSGVRSPACSATDHPFRDGSSLASAYTYFPACCHVCVRAKHDRSAPISADRSRTASPAPILAAAAAFDSFVLTST